MENIILCQPVKTKRVRIYTNCEHEKIKRYCKICNPKKFCEHSREKQTCKLCKGSGICVHNKRKILCKTCSPHLYCEHNKLKCKCKNCGSKEYCIHNKRKNICRECKGNSICIHNKQKSRCIICSPHLVCCHDKIKSRCKECGSNDYCNHGINKFKCKQCHGNAICNHNKIKYNCQDCGSNSFCEHNKYKVFCKECKGSCICIHGVKKYSCINCGYFNNMCKNCKIVRRLKKYDNHCLRCFIYLFPDKPVIRNYKTKETAVAQFVTENFPNFTWNIDKKVEDGCSKRRPDLLCDLGYQVLIVEVDENQHESYDCSCENKRIMQISQDIGHRPLIFIRFNPDDYLDCSGNNVSSCWTYTAKTGIIKIKNNKIDEWSKRLDCLKQTIEYWTNDENKTEKTIETIQLFYDNN